MIPELSKTDSCDVYPNPVNNHMTLINHQGKVIDIIIRDISGKTLKIVQTAEIQSDIDISNLSAELILIIIQSENRLETLKRVKEYILIWIKN